MIDNNDGFYVDNTFEKLNSGEPIPTPKKPFSEMTPEERRFSTVLKTIFNVCNLGGFKIEGRITLVDRKTGRVFD